MRRMSDLTYKTARQARLALQPFFVDSNGQYACRDWTLADWSNAMCGEAGEAANIVKKIRRGDRDPDLVRKLSDELADVCAYVDLLAHHAGIDLDEAIQRKFNSLAFALGSQALLIDGEYHSSRLLKSFMVLKANGQVYVKEKNFFVEQNGDREEWGKTWIEIKAESIEDARQKGAAL